MYTFKSVTTDAALNQALAIYQANRDYYNVSGMPAPTATTVDEDRREIPASLPDSAKHYWLVEEDGEPVGVIDLLEGYPEKASIYVSLLMVAEHRQGHGRAIMTQLSDAFASHGYKRLEVAVVAANKVGQAFWRAIGFSPLHVTTAQVAPGITRDVQVYTKNL